MKKNAILLLLVDALLILSLYSCKKQAPDYGSGYCTECTQGDTTVISPKLPVKHPPVKY